VAGFEVEGVFGRDLTRNSCRNHLSCLFYRFSPTAPMRSENPMRSSIQRTNTQFALGYCQARETTCRADVMRMLDCESFFARHLVLHAQHVLAVVLGNTQGKPAGKRGSGKRLHEPTGSARLPRGWQAVSSLATASVAVG
jgi:hypothetical protein